MLALCVFTTRPALIRSFSRTPALLTSSGEGATEYIDAYMRDTGTILSKAGQLLDFTQPVAITLISILHAVPDSDDPHAAAARLLDAVPPGSYLDLSHLGTDLLGRESEDGLRDVADRMMQQKFAGRGREQVARFFEGTDLVEPGLVRVEEWRPEPGTGDVAGRLCGAQRAEKANARAGGPADVSP
jgi:S-adenosyl methyltransferase